MVYSDACLFEQYPEIDSKMLTDPDQWNRQIPVLSRTIDRQWMLRSDERRCLLFEKDFTTGAVQNMVRIHPLEAVVLSLFDGDHTVGEVIDETHQCVGWNRTEAETFVRTSAGLRAKAISWLPAKSRLCQYSPRAFVMPAAAVDLRTPRLYRPICLFCHVTHACSRACIYCNVERNRVTRMLDLPRWNDLADECHEIGIPWIFLCGGDPLAHPNILEIVKAFTCRGIVPSISTKMFVSRSLAREMKAAGLRWVQYSIDAPDPETVHMMTGSPRAFQEALESIRNLIIEGVNVRTNSVLTKHNLADFPRLLRMLIDLGVRSLQGASCQMSCHRPGSRFLLFGPEQAQTVIPQVNEIRFQYPSCDIEFSGTGASFDPARDRRADTSRTKCFMGRSAMTVLPDGKVTLCSAFPRLDSLVVGDLSSQSIMEVWNSESMMSFIRPSKDRFAGTACYTCQDFDDCQANNDRCRSNCLTAFGSVFTPDPNCPRAPSPPYGG